MRNFTETLMTAKEIHEMIMKAFNSIPNAGYSREEMPQIEDVKLFLKQLDKLKIKYRYFVKPCKSVKPAQNELSEDKILNAISENFDPKTRVYICSSDNYLLDGHHSWAVNLFRENNFTMQGYVVDLNIHDLIQLAQTLDGTSYKKLHEGLELNGVSIGDFVKSSDKAGRVIAFKGHKNEVVVIAEQPYNIRTELDVKTVKVIGRGIDKINESVEVGLLPKNFISALAKNKLLFVPNGYNRYECKLVGTLYIPMLILSDKTDAQQITNIEPSIKLVDELSQDSNRKIEYDVRFAKMTNSINIHDRQKMIGASVNNVAYAALPCKIEMQELSVQSDDITIKDAVIKNYHIHAKYIDGRVVIKIPVEDRKTIDIKDYDHYKLFKNSSNTLFNDLMLLGFEVFPDYVIRTNNIPSHVAYKCVPLIPIKECLEVIKTFNECLDLRLQVPENLVEAYDNVEAYEIEDIVNEKYDEKAGKAKQLLNLLLGKGRQIKNLGKAMETSMIQKTIAEMDYEIKSDNLEPEARKKMKVISDKKAEIQEDLIANTKDKMDQIAGNDERLERIAMKEKTRASINADKKRLAYLKQLQDEPEIERVERRIEKEQTRYQEIEKEVEEFEEQMEDKAGGEEKLTDKEKVTRDIDVKLEKTDTELSELRTNLKSETKPEERAKLKLQTTEKELQKIDLEIERFDTLARYASGNKDRKEANAMVNKVNELRKKKETIQQSLKELDPEDVVKKREDTLKEIDEVKAFIKEQDQKYAEGKEKLKTPRSQHEHKEVQKEVNELYLAALDARKEYFQLNIKLADVNSDKEAKEKAMKQLEEVQVNIDKASKTKF